VYIYGAPSKARNANVVYIWIYVYIYTTLAFLALLGAPYIYDISSLRVNPENRNYHLLRGGRLKSHI